MKYKNIPAIIMLSAGAIASIVCIFNKFSLLNMLKVILVVLLIFYVIGLIVNRVLSKINNESYTNYVKKTREEMKSAGINTEEESVTLEEDVREIETGE